MDISRWTGRTILYIVVFILATNITIYALAPAWTTAGHQFVVSFPYLFQATERQKGNSTLRVGTIYVSTEEIVAVVDLFLPIGGNGIGRCKQPKYSRITKVVKQYGVINFDIDQRYSLKQNGIHCALYIKASASVRAWAIVFSDGMSEETDGFVDTNDVFTEAFKLIPFWSSRNIYHLSTKIGHPFVMIMSFEFDQTEIQFKIPRPSETHIYGMSEKCGPDQQCLTRDRDSIYLRRYEVWFFYLEGNLPDLHAIHVIADHPVFVVSGNLRCYDDERSVMDICASALTPEVTWGRKMFVPSLPWKFPDRAKIEIRINAVKFPVHVDIYSLRTKTTSTYWVKEPLSVLYLSSDSNHVMNAEMHFQVSVYTYIRYYRNDTVHVHASTLNVIPVNQWLSGHAFQSTSREHKLRFDVSELLLIVSTIEGGKMVCKTKKRSENHFAIQEIRWDEYRDTFPPDKKTWSRKFYEKIIENPEDTICFIDEQHGDSLHFNYVTIPTDTVFAFTMMPWDYYLAQLVRCEVLEENHDTADDGVDNDCDGRVDEEYKNGEDDDGDGIIDEDYQSRYHRSGQWAAWSDVCKGSGKAGNGIKVRSCTQSYTTRFGRYCDGRSIKCNNSICSKQQLSTHRNEIVDCLCKRGCNDCKNKRDDTQDLIEQGVVCTECKPGYYPELYCTARCPFDRIGRSCIDHKVEYKSAIRIEEKSGLILGLVLSFGITCFILTIVVAGLAYFEKKKRERKRKMAANNQRRSKESQELEEEYELEDDDDDDDNDDDDDDDEEDGVKGVKALFSTGKNTGRRDSSGSDSTL